MGRYVMFNLMLLFQFNFSATPMDNLIFYGHSGPMIIKAVYGVYCGFYSYNCRGRSILEKGFKGLVFKVHNSLLPHLVHSKQLHATHDYSIPL